MNSKFYKYNSTSGENIAHKKKDLPALNVESCESKDYKSYCQI